MNTLSRQSCQVASKDTSSPALVPPATRYAEPLTPIDALYRRVETRPDRTAFIASGKAWTYQRLATEAEHLARALLARGIQQGDRVALHMANLPELAVAYYACFRIGAIAAPLNIRLKTPELRPLLQRLRPALYLGQGQLYPYVAPIEPEVLAPDARFVIGNAADHWAQSWASLVADAAADEGPIPRSPGSDAPAVLLATSGTTGQPKLVVHTPATLSAIAASFTHLGLSRGQTVLLALPMVHGAALTILLSCVHFGAPMVLLERFDPDIALDAIEAHRCSWVMGLPFMWAEMLRHQQQRPREVGSLRHCISAGDVCPPGLQEEFAAAFGGVPLRSVLASSEIAWSLTYGLQPGPVSRIAPGTEVRVVDDAGAAVPRGESGELLVRSPKVAPGAITTRETTTCTSCCGKAMGWPDGVIRVNRSCVTVTSSAPDDRTVEDKGVLSWPDAGVVSGWLRRVRRRPRCPAAGPAPPRGRACP